MGQRPLLALRPKGPPLCRNAQLGGIGEVNCKEGPLAKGDGGFVQIDNFIFTQALLCAIFRALAVEGKNLVMI